MATKAACLGPEQVRLVNGSTGDPVLFVDYPGKNDAFLFDCGDLARIERKRLGDIQALFLTHHHIDHVNGFDQVLRANLDSDKTVHVFGPEGTIDRLHRRITSYVLGDFAFMKIVFEIHEVRAGEVSVARLECAKRFPPPEPIASRWRRPVLFETAEWAVEATLVDHTAPCLAYALVEKPGYHVDPARWQEGLLKPGPWLGEAQRRLRAGEPLASTLEIQGGSYTLAALADRYFYVSKGGRIAFVTDTAWNETTQPALVKLASRARRLYCDSYYSIQQAKSAVKHKHMTATFAAELASRAKVDELVLMHFAPRYAGAYDALVREAQAIFPKTSAQIDP